MFYRERSLNSVTTSLAVVQYHSLPGEFSTWPPRFFNDLCSLRSIERPLSQRPMN